MPGILTAARPQGPMKGQLRMTLEGSILIVDDEESVREAVEAALAPRFTVVGADSAAAALDAMCLRAFDLILLDYRLPDVPGTEILRLIKKFYPATLVVIITGHGSEEVAVQALRGGARDYLRKPFDAPELETRVRSLLALRRTAAERRRNPLADPYGSHPFRRPGIAEDPEVAERARLVFRAVRYIEEHLEEELTLADVARVAGMSKFHFCRRFQVCTGQRFRDFLARRRVERAKELMRLQGRPLTDIFRDVGFRDMTHFTRVFKRIEGQVPSEHRRRQRAEDATVPPPSPSPA
jgi:YesN/AraC family two-component response regulator